MISIAICSDQRAEATALQQALQEMADALFAEIEIRLFRTGIELLCAKPPIAFLLIDTVLPDAQGLDIAQAFRLRDAVCPILFLSSTAQEALACYTVHPVDYLLYPVDMRRLFSTLARNRNIFLPSMRYIETTISHLRQRILLANITFVEVQGRHCSIHQISGEVSIVNNSLDRLCANLHPDAFVRVHRSYVVNLYHILRFNTDSLLMAGGGTVPLSRENTTALASRLPSSSVRETLSMQW